MAVNVVHDDRAGGGTGWRQGRTNVDFAHWWRNNRDRVPRLFPVRASVPLIALAVVFGRPDEAHAAPVSKTAAIEPPPRAEYLARPLSPSPRFLDHGVLQAAVAGGTPHRYRLEVSLGLLDHLSLGVTGHWLAGQSAPKFSPRIAVAFWRWRWVAVGATYHWTLYPPPVVDLDVTTPSYQQTAQWVLGAMSFGQRWISGGFDAGIVRVREDDPAADPGDNLRNPSRVRVRFGGGLFARAGTRRWGVSGRVLLPALSAEVALDVRFGLFERRPRGGWLPLDKAGRGGLAPRPWHSR